MSLSRPALTGFPAYLGAEVRLLESWPGHGLRPWPLAPRPNPLAVWRLRQLLFRILCDSEGVLLAFGLEWCGFGLVGRGSGWSFAEPGGGDEGALAERSRALRKLSGDCAKKHGAGGSGNFVVGSGGLVVMKMRLQGLPLASR